MKCKVAIKSRVSMRPKKYWLLVKFVRGEAKNKMNPIIKLMIVGRRNYCHMNNDLLNERDEQRSFTNQRWWEQC